MLKIVCVCGARPNFMKVAPIMEAMDRAGGIESLLVHTGQHYDEKMSRLFFDDLGLRAPDVNLHVAGGSHAALTAEIMKRFEPVCVEHQPDCVLVVGDVNSTLACALTAAKLGIPVAHVEAGLRSFDRSMPEEINRVVTDAISDLLLVSEPSGIDNLRREGVAAEKVHLVGNVMVDTLLAHRARADRSDILTRLKLRPQAYAVTTVHRAGNVDHDATLSSILDALRRISDDLPVVFPVHPRTRARLDAIRHLLAQGDGANLRMTEPFGYLDFLKLMADAAIVLTDSGGIQEETTILGVPCLTLRVNTERPITITQGTNRLVGTDTATIVSAYHEVRDCPSKGSPPSLWDGRAADRIVACLVQDLPLRGTERGVRDRLSRPADRKGPSFSSPANRCGRTFPGKVRLTWRP